MGKASESPERKAGITIRLRDDLISLVDFYKEEQERAGTPASDSGISAASVGYRDLTSSLRGWPANGKSPTLKSLVKLEVWLRDAIGEEQYQAFIQRRAALVLPDGGF